MPGSWAWLGVLSTARGSIRISKEAMDLVRRGRSKKGNVVETARLAGILGAKRTPFGAFGGTLRDLSATDLGVHAAKAAIAQAGVPPDDFGHVVIGNVAQTSADAIYLAGHVGLRAGLPDRIPAVAVNRLCGSGFEALVQAAMWIAGDFWESKFMTTSSWQERTIEAWRMKA